MASLSSKTFLAIAISFLFACGNTQQILDGIDGVLNESASEPSSFEIANGLKAALEKGTIMGVDQLHAADGFFKSAYKIPFPDEAIKVKNTLTDLGLGGEVDKVVLTINRAAEAAVDEAKPLFINAIKEMTIQDAKSILFGEDNAATNYLKSKTTRGLTQAFKPKISLALDQVNATKYWSEVISRYNQIPLVEDVNPDLEQYVTEKAITALFSQIAIEEKAIRQNPIERTSEILRKVFGYAGQNSN